MPCWGKRLSGASPGAVPRGEAPQGAKSWVLVGAPNLCFASTHAQAHTHTPPCSPGPKTPPRMVTSPWCPPHAAAISSPQRPGSAHGAAVVLLLQGSGWTRGLFFFFFPPPFYFWLQEAQRQQMFLLAPAVILAESILDSPARLLKERGMV